MIFLQDTVVVSSIKVTLRLELNRDNMPLVSIEALVVILLQSPGLIPALYTISQGPLSVELTVQVSDPTAPSHSQLTTVPGQVNWDRWTTGEAEVCQ